MFEDLDATLPLNIPDVHPTPPSSPALAIPAAAADTIRATLAAALDDSEHDDGDRHPAPSGSPSPDGGAPAAKLRRLTERPAAVGPSAPQRRLAGAPAPAPPVAVSDLLASMRRERLENPTARPTVREAAAASPSIDSPSHHAQRPTRAPAGRAHTRDVTAVGSPPVVPDSSSSASASPAAQPSRRHATSSASAGSSAPAAIAASTGTTHTAAASASPSDALRLQLAHPPFHLPPVLNGVIVAFGSHPHCGRFVVGSAAAARATAAVAAAGGFVVTNKGVYPPIAPALLRGLLPRHIFLASRGLNNGANGGSQRAFVPARVDESAEVLPLPTHVLLTLGASDRDRRRRLASIRSHVCTASVDESAGSADVPNVPNRSERAEALSELDKAVSMSVGPLVKMFRAHAYPMGLDTPYDFVRGDGSPVSHATASDSGPNPPCDFPVDLRSIDWPERCVVAGRALPED